MRLTRFLFVLCVGAAAATSAHSAQFCVGTTAELQAALAAAPTTGGDDLILVKPGLYIGAPTAAGRAVFEFDGLGGVYVIGSRLSPTGDCSLSFAGPGEVILSGSGQYPVMSLRNAGDFTQVAAANLRIVNGLATLNRAGGLTLEVASGGTTGAALGLRLILEGHVSNQAQTPAAFSLEAYAGEAQLINSLVRNNDSTGFTVGRMMSFGGNAVVNNSTIVGNLSGSAGRGVIGVNGSSAAYLSNNVFWNNQSGSAGALLDLTADGASVILRNNHIQATSAIAGGTVTSFAATTGDPRFVSTTDLRLQPQSPARNTGTLQAFSIFETERTLDLAIRVQGGAIDRGAYEFPDVFRDGFE